MDPTESKDAPPAGDRATKAKRGRIVTRRGPPPGIPRPRTGGMLAAVRLELGVTLAELAARLGMSANYLSMLERGDRCRPSAAAVRRLARGYGVPEALVRSVIGGGGDREAFAEWLRGRAEQHRARAAELERAAGEMEGDDRQE
jgi:transcriptional regulator with XRE-family HTH domain